MLLTTFAGRRYLNWRSELLNVRSECRVGRFGDPPWQFLKLHAVEDDRRSPDIDETSVILYEVKVRASPA